jgi:histidinol-phosphate aminotransferase
MEDFVLSPHILAMPLFGPEKALQELQEEHGLETIIDLGSNENPLGPSPLAMEAVNRAATNMHRYSNISVVAEQLRFKLAASIGPSFSRDNIILGNGSVDVLRMAAEVFLHEGGEVLIRRNAFPLYELVTRRYGGECVFMETRADYTFDLLSVVEGISDQTRLIFLTNPDNPSGMIFTQQELDDFVGRVPPSVLVVLDHAYQEYAEAEGFPDVTKYVLDGRNVLVTRTFSKIYGLAGLRIGYGIARQEIIEYMSRSRVPFYTGAAAPTGAMVALDDVEHVKSSRNLNAEGKKYLYQKFDELDLSYLPSQSYFILLVDFKHDTNVVAEAMLRRGVIVRPCHPFNMPQAIRVTVGKPEENERLVKALRQTLEELGSSG